MLRTRKEKTRGADVEEEVELEQVQLHVQEEEEVAEVLFPFSAGLGAVHGDGVVDGKGGEKPAPCSQRDGEKETERQRGGWSWRARVGAVSGVAYKGEVRCMGVIPSLRRSTWHRSDCVHTKEEEDARQGSLYVFGLDWSWAVTVEKKEHMGLVET
jgi:hypothetical protein